MASWLSVAPVKSNFKLITFNRFVLYFCRTKFVVIVERDVNFTRICRPRKNDVLRFCAVRAVFFATETARPGPGKERRIDGEMDCELDARDAVSEIDRRRRRHECELSDTDAELN